MCVCVRRPCGLAFQSSMRDPSGTFKYTEWHYLWALDIHIHKYTIDVCVCKKKETWRRQEEYEHKLHTAYWKSLRLSHSMFSNPDFWTRVYFEALLAKFPLLITSYKQMFPGERATIHKVNFFPFWSSYSHKICYIFVFTTGEILKVYDLKFLEFKSSTNFRINIVYRSPSNI